MDSLVAGGVFDSVQRADEFLAHMAALANKIIYGIFRGRTLTRTPLRKLRCTVRSCPTHFYRRHQIVELFQGIDFGRVEVLPVPSGHLAWGDSLLAYDPANSAAPIVPASVPSVASAVRGASGAIFQANWSK